MDERIIIDPLEEKDIFREKDKINTRGRKDNCGMTNRYQIAKYVL